MFVEKWLRGCKAAGLKQEGHFPLRFKTTGVTVTVHSSHRRALRDFAAGFPESSAPSPYSVGILRDADEIEDGEERHSGSGVRGRGGSGLCGYGLSAGQSAEARECEQWAEWCARRERCRFDLVSRELSAGGRRISQAFGVAQL